LPQSGALVLWSRAMRLGAERDSIERSRSQIASWSIALRWILEISSHEAQHPAFACRRQTTSPNNRADCAPVSTSSTYTKRGITLCGSSPRIRYCRQSCVRKSPICIAAVTPPAAGWYLPSRQLGVRLRSPRRDQASGMQWLERYLVESSPRLQHFAEARPVLDTD